MHENFTISLVIDKYVGILYQPKEQNWQKCATSSWICQNEHFCIMLGHKWTQLFWLVVSKQSKSFK